MSISFFVRTDLHGLVNEAYWSSPVSFAIPFVTNLHDMFSGQESEDFSMSFSTVVEEQNKVLCRHVGTKGVETHLCLFLVRVEHLVWVLAVDYLDTVDLEIRKRIGQTFSDLVKHFALLHTKKDVQDSQSIYNHFEQIQRLNNELVNTHRRLQRANRQLEVLNEELNNRLVKDPLTGLVSRYQYRSEMLRVIALQPREMGVFVFVDIDGFKDVNDTYGHAVGDEFLVAFSDRLRKLDFGLPTILMRIAGDEFGIYIHGVVQPDGHFLTLFWKQFSQLVLSPNIRTSAGELPVSSSAGLAVFNRDSDNIYELIDYADWAMYQAKRSGKNRCVLFDKQVFVSRSSDHVPSGT